MACTLLLRFPAWLGRSAMGLRLLVLFAVVVGGPWTQTAEAQAITTPRLPVVGEAGKVAGRALRWRDSVLRDPSSAQRLSEATGLRTWGNTIALEAWPQTSVWQAADVAAVRRLGVDVQAAGVTRLLLRVAAQDLAVLAALPAVRWLAPPDAPLPLGVTSQGVALTGAKPFLCTLAGAGQTIAVLDSGFLGYSELVGAGEVPFPDQLPTLGYHPHGSACAEVVADMAPAAAILPVHVDSVASLEAWVTSQLSNGKVDVISHSLGWYGTSFGNGKGPLCDLVSQSRAAGIWFVTAAGNANEGSVWHGPWRDNNSDGWLEFADGTQVNTMIVPAQAAVVAHLDWDDYPYTTTDLALVLCKVGAGTCDPVATADDPQQGSQPPHEVVFQDAVAPGVYGWQIKHLGGPLPTAVRLDVGISGMALADYATATTLADPAACADALTIAAVDRSDWSSGAVAGYSSQGPTWDGRIKPDLAGPTGVASLIYGSFAGTSAATPHVAGAVALLQSAGLGPEEVRLELLASAVPQPGQTGPNSATGYGRLDLRFDLSGAACDPDSGLALACTSACGSAGTAVCSNKCEVSACKGPAEVCDGVDQDCDGQTDEGFACSAGQTAGCSTVCDSPGQRTCVDCKWSTCKALGEACNGRDDDCDGAYDEDFACAVGDVAECQLKGGGNGARICSNGCEWGPCQILEVCNGMDDDGNGTIDDGAVCDEGCSAGRRAGPGFGVVWSITTAILFWRRRHHPSRQPQANPHH